MKNVHLGAGLIQNRRWVRLWLCKSIKIPKYLLWFILRVTAQTSAAPSAWKEQRVYEGHCLTPRNSEACKTFRTILSLPSSLGHKAAQHATCFCRLLAWLTQDTQEICFSETSGSLRTIRRYNPGDCTLRVHCCDILKSQVFMEFPFPLKIYFQGKISSILLRFCNHLTRK